MPSKGTNRAVVTGASTGMGAAMARQLAARGYDLVLTARRLELLEQLADELQNAHAVQVQCVGLDLTTTDAPAALENAAFANGADVDLLINNAGFGHYADFVNADPERIAAMMQLNMRALVELTQRFARRLTTRQRPGYIGNIASILAYAPVPQLAVYAASKAFVRSFSEAVASELQGTQVSCTSISLGWTATEFNDVAGIAERTATRPLLMNVDRAARIALRGILRRRRNVVPGVLFKLGAFFSRFLPRRTASWIITWILGKPASPGNTQL